MDPLGDPPTKELFLDALERPEGERAAFVAAACGGDAARRTRIGALLAAHARAADLDALLTAPPPPPLPLPRPFGDLELREEIGHGASGTVYRAHQPSLGREVAVKVLRAGRFATGDELRRFRREAAAVARLDHPNIVPVHDSGEVDGQPFFTMKRLEGGSLARAHDRFRGRPRDAARLMAKVARAVDHAHLRGILHRDLKPSNLLLDAAGEPYVADFGIARASDDRDPESRGALLGTPAYMAPEQAAGRDVTVASDLFALGSVLHELLAGAPPFGDGDVGEVLERIRHGEPAALPLAGGIDRDLTAIVARCLEKEPARRYRSAAALADDLERWLDHQPIAARPATRVERLRLLWRRSPVAVALSGAVAALLLVLAVGSIAANRALERRLRAALLAQAQAEQLSDRAGRVGRALGLLAQAAAIEPGRDLESAAITTLTQLDLVEEGGFEVGHGEDEALAIDDALERIAFARDDGAVEVRSLADDALLAQLPPAPGRVIAAAFAPGARELGLRRVGPGPDDPAATEIWSLPDAKQRASFPAATRAPVWDDAGAWIALPSDDGAVELRDARSLAVVRRVVLPTRIDRCLFRGDGTQLAVAIDPPAQLVILDVATGATVATLPHDATVIAAAWSRDGRRLITGTHGHEAIVWRLADGVAEARLRGHSNSVTRVALLDGGRAATSSWDGTTRIWDLRRATCELVARGDRLAGDVAGRRSIRIAGRRIVRERLEEGRLLASIAAPSRDGPAESVEVGAAGRLAAIGDDGWGLYDPARDAPLVVQPLDAGRALRADPLGEALFVSGGGGLVRIELDDARPREGVRWLDGPTRRFDVSRDGRRLAVARGWQLLALERPAGDARAVAIARPIDEPHRGLDRVVLSPDATLVATGSWGGTGVRLWDFASGALLRHLLPEESQAVPAFDPRGGRIAIATRDRVVIVALADGATTRALGRVSAPRAAEPCAWSSDGALLAIGAEPGAIRLVRTDDWSVVADLAAATPLRLADLRFATGDGRLDVATGTGAIASWRVDAIAPELARRAITRAR